jgi:hypothetical protein
MHVSFDSEPRPVMPEACLPRRLSGGCVKYAPILLGIPHSSLHNHAGVRNKKVDNSEVIFSRLYGIIFAIILPKGKRKLLI